MTKLETFECSGKANRRSRCPVGAYRSSTGVPSSWEGLERSSRRSHTLPRGSTSSAVIVVRKDAGTLRAAIASGQPGDDVRSIESSSLGGFPLPIVIPHPASRRTAQESFTAVHRTRASVTVGEQPLVASPKARLDGRGRGGAEVAIGRSRTEERPFEEWT